MKNTVVTFKNTYALDEPISSYIIDTMELKSFRTALNFPDIPERLVQGKMITLVSYVSTFYYRDVDTGLYVICEYGTGRSIGAGSTLKMAKERAMEILDGNSPEAVIRVIDSLPHLN